MGYIHIYIYIHSIFLIVGSAGFISSTVGTVMEGGTFPNQNNES